jgi:hypothetical protein
MLRKYRLFVELFPLTATTHSERMFKRRIQKWQLDKNNKEHEMRVIMHLVKQRRLDGLNPLQAVRLRYRNIPLSEVARYFRRKGIKEPEHLAGDHFAGKMRNGHEGAQANQSAIFQVLPCPGRSSLLKESVANIELPQIISVGSTPGSFQDASSLATLFPQEMLHRPLSLNVDEITSAAVIGQTHHFYAGWCDKPPSKANKVTGLKVFMLPRVALQFDQCIYRLRCGSHTTAFKILDHIFDNIRLWGKCLGPAALILTLSFVKVLTDYSMNCLAQQLLSYIAAMTEIIYGAGHPTQTVTQSLLKAAPSLRSQLIQRTLYNMRDIIGKDCDSTSIWTYFFRRRVFHTLTYTEALSARKHFTAAGASARLPLGYETEPETYRNITLWIENQIQDFVDVSGDSLDPECPQAAEASGIHSLGFDVQPQTNQDITVWIENQLEGWEDVSWNFPGLFPDRYKFPTSAKSIRNAIKIVCNAFRIPGYAEAQKNVEDTNAKAYMVGLDGPADYSPEA